MIVTLDLALAQDSATSPPILAKGRPLDQLRAAACFGKVEKGLKQLWKGLETTAWLHPG